MNTPLAALPFSVRLPGAEKKKRVLLVDASSHKRDLRAEVMRKLGIDVDCAADIVEARSWWRADLYDLVLVNMEKGHGHRDRFCDDMRAAKPPQRLAFLVGGPAYLADLPNEDEQFAVENANTQATIGDVKAALSAVVGELTQRWGILEASRRISAVRSTCSARSKAMRDRPVAPRDLEGRASKRNAESITLDDLLKEVMQ
jgi:CheY-like chemotaxis protein